MATETGPDLGPAIEAVEALMDDTCIITFDPEGVDDDVIDESTGRLIVTPGDSTVVYDGKCKVTPWSRQQQPLITDQDGLELRPRWYVGSIPVASDVPEVGAIFTLTSSRRDPWLLGKPFIIKVIQGSTFSISRKFMMELRG